MGWHVKLHAAFSRELSRWIVDQCTKHPLGCEQRVAEAIEEDRKAVRARHGRPSQAQEVKMLREALKFYANAWVWPAEDYYDFPTSTLTDEAEKDRGTIARRTLTATQTNTGEK